MVKGFSRMVGNLRNNTQGNTRRVLIDATYTMASGKSSGIERVVRSVLRESSRVADRYQVRCEPVFSHRGKFYFVQEAQRQCFASIAAFEGHAFSRLPPGYRRIAEKVCQATGSRRIKKWLAPSPGHLGAFKVPHLIMESLGRRRAASEGEEVRFGNGDVLILPDAYWAEMYVWPAVAKARAQGAFCATMIYDLIPITHREFVGDKRHLSFIQYLIQASSNSDLLIAISETVRDQVREYLPKLFPENNYCHDVRAFPLGAELKEVNGSVRPEVVRCFQDSQNSPYLMVATFDPRKNHHFLLDAFDRLWKANEPVKLVLAGRVGGLCDDVIRRIENHPKLNELLYVFHDLSDVEIQHCYRNARGMIFPSIVEGFGLPIVEAQWYGKRTFASDTPIHREVGKNDSTYFSLDDPGELANAIRDWERAISQGASLTSVQKQPLTWERSTELLLRECLSAAEAGERDTRSLHARAA